jgi:hypothetical protein
VKPTLFIGSSRARLPIAHGLKTVMAEVADVTVWDEAPEFAVNDAILDALIKAANLYDFTLLVFGQDDCTMMGTEPVPTVRDNVMFELGLFMGRLGKGRALWLSPTGSKAPHLATDLGGIVHLEYDEPDLRDAAAITCALVATREKIRQRINTSGRRTDLTRNVVPMRQALCLASSQYSQARFQQDLEYIHSFFSKDEVTSEQGVTADRFQDYFAPGPRWDGHWDIVHLGFLVDKEKQQMLFDAPSPGGREAQGHEAIERMIRDCGAALVVIITCDSLRFGAPLARFTNVIVGHKPIEPPAAISWAKNFYRELSFGVPLSKAFDKAQDLGDPGLVLLARRDIRFVRQSPA